MDYVAEAMVILREVVSLAERTGRLTAFCIGNTRKVDRGGLFFSPMRITTRMVAGSVVVYSTQEAIAISSALDGHVQYILVDTEKKISRELYAENDVGNIERAVRECVKKSRILTYKGNDVSVDAIDALLSQLVCDPVRGIGGKKVGIIGAGNLGCKLALKLVERGAYVTISRRNPEALDVIVRALNLIKPAETIAAVRGTTDNEAVARGADVLIGLTAGQPVLTVSMIDALSAGAVVVDGGKGCLLPQAQKRAEERGLLVLRVDIRPAFEGQVATLLEMEHTIKHAMGRRQIGGVNIVSGGVLGRAGEVVVDNVNKPTMVFGVADGLGDFARVLSTEQVRNVSIVKGLLGRP